MDMEILTQAHDLLLHGDAEARAEAIDILGEAAYAPAVPALTELVEESDPGTQFLAARALGRIGDEAESAVPSLLVALRADDMYLRMAATGALISIGHPSVPGLIKALFDNKRAVRRASAKALGKIGHPRAISALSVVAKDPDAGVRRFANEALARLESNEAG